MRTKFKFLAPLLANVGHLALGVCNIWKINNIASVSNNGARKIEFGLFDGRDVGKLWRYLKYMGAIFFFIFWRNILILHLGLGSNNRFWGTLTMELNQDINVGPRSWAPKSVFLKWSVNITGRLASFVNNCDSHVKLDLFIQPCMLAISITILHWCLVNLWHRVMPTTTTMLLDSPIN